MAFIFQIGWIDAIKRNKPVRACGVGGEVSV